MNRYIRQKKEIAPKSDICVEKFFVFTRAKYNFEKKKKKKVLGKKVCAFEFCLVLFKKYTKSFGGKNRASFKRFSPTNSQVYILF